MIRLQSTGRELDSLYLPSEAPQNFADFGPVGAPSELAPLQLPDGPSPPHFDAVASDGFESVLNDQPPFSDCHDFVTSPFFPYMTPSFFCPTYAQFRNPPLTDTEVPYAFPSVIGAECPAKKEETFLSVIQEEKSDNAVSFRPRPQSDPLPQGRKSFVTLEEEQRQQTTKPAVVRTRPKAQPFEQVFREEAEKRILNQVPLSPSGFAPIPLGTSGFYVSKTPIPDFSVCIRPPHAQSVW
jgi:hypothetical protein